MARSESLVISSNCVVKFNVMDQPDKIADSELPRIDQDREVAPHAQEIEYALILQRMINVVSEDPEQMRLAIYQLARAKLKSDTGWANEVEKKRLTTALETAIQGVEKFSVVREERERLLPSPAAAQSGSDAPGTASPSSAATVIPLTPGPQDIFTPERTYPASGFQPVMEVRTTTLLATLARFCVGMTMFTAVFFLGYYRERLPFIGERLRFAQPPSPMLAKPASSPPISDASQQAAGVTELQVVTASPSPLPFPVPTDYGIYALNDGALNELQLLPERVPDKRVAMSTPVNEPSRTMLSDGRAKFILFRRDLAGNAPDRMDVRVVARVVRALTFDAKGKPGYSPVSDAWNIRNKTYEFRVRPIPGYPEMLLVQSDKPDFTLLPGRYILVLKDQGYDFTIAGKVTDPVQCLERTDAANGEFYSECQKP
jgi:hypothetical protein